MRRQYLTRADETRRVKAALKEAGINALVTHGRGTAWGWLEINIGAGQDFGEHDSNELHGKSQCRRCVQLRTMEQEALQVAQEETGRHGEWDGQILILTQDHWNQSKRCSVPITQPWWEQYHPLHWRVPTEAQLRIIVHPTKG